MMFLNSLRETEKRISGFVEIESQRRSHEGIDEVIVDYCERNRPDMSPD